MGARQRDKGGDGGEPEVGRAIEPHVGKDIHHGRQAKPVAIETRNVFAGARAAQPARPGDPVGRRRGGDRADLDPRTAAQGAIKRGDAGLHRVQRHCGPGVGRVGIWPRDHAVPQRAHGLFRFKEVAHLHGVTRIRWP